ncbi:I78 family peptidase inhibitor [Paracoccus cavernae]|uniref:I78 family peptidase inhibitor n=1 Tax=Paracoccus cavernae TaxID=1571207 RepID=A0ABT8D7H7_9RHOB|nr:I78 family peptidase inhibitor [Paracoccus cavernae]
MNKFLIALMAVAPLAACAPAPQQIAPEVMAPTPVLTPVAGISGLESREPDACHAKDYTSALGQPGSVIPTLGVTRSFRVVEYRGIEPQEYDPLRIVFRLDQAGNIYNIDCG